MFAVKQSLLRCNAQLMTVALRQQSQSAVQGGKVFRHFEANGFSVKGIKNAPAIWPLIVILGGTCVGLTGFILYAAQTRENVIFNKSHPTFSDSMNVMEPKKLKMRVINQQYKPNPELDAALQYKNEGADDQKAE